MALDVGPVIAFVGMQARSKHGANTKIAVPLGKSPQETAWLGDADVARNDTVAQNCWSKIVRATDDQMTTN